MADEPLLWILYRELPLTLETLERLMADLRLAGKLEIELQGTGSHPCATDIVSDVVSQAVEGISVSNPKKILENRATS